MNYELVSSAKKLKNVMKILCRLKFTLSLQ